LQQGIVIFLGRQINNILNIVEACTQGVNTPDNSFQERSFFT